MQYSPGMSPNLEAARNVDNAACRHSEANFAFASKCVYHIGLQMVSLVVCSQLGNLSLPSSNTGDYWDSVPLHKLFLDNCMWKRHCLHSSFFVPVSNSGLTSSRFARWTLKFF